MSGINIKDLQINILSLIDVLLVVTVVSFLLFRVLNLTPDLINKHSWGESQYAMWASSYLRDGYFFGVREVDYFKPFTNYIPIASYLAAAVSDLFATDLVFTGRMISFLFSVLSVVFFYKLAGIIFNDKFQALVTTVIFVVLPINMYYSGMLYNDPIHLFFIVYLTYLLFSKRDSAGIKFYYSSVFMLTILI
ncbi:MAG: phospholipid carrier-dependent glycosyltransferase, partial [Sulfurovum sp.]|nr:glycosyltransferase family 39 protein [Sulfurovum sp.]NNJ45035.1 phospholipid carrier-dependent glycosyltransferase [Sulfurovum sp.]